MMATKQIDNPKERQVFKCDQCDYPVIYDPGNIVKGLVAATKSPTVSSGDILYIDCINPTPHTNVCIVK